MIYCTLNIFHVKSKRTKLALCYFVTDVRWDTNAITIKMPSIVRLRVAKLPEIILSSVNLICYAPMFLILVIASIVQCMIVLNLTNKIVMRTME